MTAFVKPLVLTAFAVGSLAVAGSNKQETPPAPPVPPVGPAPVAAPSLPAVAQGVTVPRGTVFSGQGYGSGSYSFSPFGHDPRAQELVRKVLDAKDDDAREKAREDLRKLLSKSFDERLKGQEKQVEELEKQLKKLKEMVKRRKDAKDEIVTDRMTALEKEVKGLGW